MNDERLSTLCITVERLVEAAAHLFDVSSDEIMGRARYEPLSRARQLVSYLAFERCGRSYSEIGRRFKRDHTTIMHGHRQTRGRLSRGDTRTAEQLERIWNMAIKPGPITDLAEPPHFTTTAAPRRPAIDQKKLDQVDILRKRGLNVPAIARYTGLDEWTVAKRCGLPQWQGRPTMGVA